MRHSGASPVWQPVPLQQSNATLAADGSILIDIAIDEADLKQIAGCP